MEDLPGKAAGSGRCMDSPEANPKTGNRSHRIQDFRLIRRSERMDIEYIAYL
jgi:hypothetical protein